MLSTTKSTQKPKNPKTPEPATNVPPPAAQSRETKDGGGACEARKSSVNKLETKRANVEPTIQRQISTTNGFDDSLFFIGLVFHYFGGEGRF